MPAAAYRGAQVLELPMRALAGSLPPLSPFPPTARSPACSKWEPEF